MSASICCINFGASGEGQALLKQSVFSAVEPRESFLDYLVEPYSRNRQLRHRNSKQAQELLAPWCNQVIRQPSMFAADVRDSGLKFPSSKPLMENFSKTLPGLRGSHILEIAGHWIRPASTADQLAFG